MKIKTVVILRPREQWMRLIERGLTRIDAELQVTGGDPDDLLSCWVADCEAFADVVHGLVALGFPVDRESLILAGMTPPPPGIGRDDDRL